MLLLHSFRAVSSCPHSSPELRHYCLPILSVVTPIFDTPNSYAQCTFHLTIYFWAQWGTYRSCTLSLAHSRSWILDPARHTLPLRFRQLACSLMITWTFSWQNIAARDGSNSWFLQYHTLALYIIWQGCAVRSLIHSRILALRLHIQKHSQAHKAQCQKGLTFMAVGAALKPRSPAHITTSAEHSSRTVLSMGMLWPVRI